MLQHGLDEVGQQRTRHRSRRARIEIGHQRDRLLAVKRASDDVAARIDQGAELRRRARHLDLEIAHRRDFAREADQKRNRQVDAAQRRILHHDRDGRRFGDGGEVLQNTVFVGAQPRAMVGRHQHQHRGTGGGGGFGALRGDAGAEMAAGDDHRDAAADMGQAQVGECRALVVGQQELLGIVGQHADAVYALIHHAIEHAPLAVEVEVAGCCEGCGRDRIDAGMDR